MSGIKYFLDTNAIIALLAGNRFIETKLKDAGWIGTSVIAVLEFLSYPDLSFEDELAFYLFLERIEVVGISSNIGFLESLATFKIESKLKLPDALIAGYAIQYQATLSSYINLARQALSQYT